MGTTTRPPRYRSYLLRFWEERSRSLDIPPAWRFSLEDPRTGHKRGFGSLAALMEAVLRELAAEDPPAEKSSQV